MMKMIYKIAAIIITLLTVLALSVFTFFSYADDAIATVSGTEFLREGQIYSVTYSIDNISCCGFQGRIDYDTSILRIVSSSVKLSGWSSEISESGEFLIYSNTPEDREYDYNGGELVTVNFEVGNIAVGSEIELFFRNVIASDSEKDIPVADASFSKKVDAPESNNATLQSLIVGGCSITPSFSPLINDYSIVLGVEYTTDSLDITAVADDVRASVEITGNELQVGNNVVEIRVTSESGITNIYTVSVRRNHDPSQPFFGDSRLSEIKLSQGELSPSFSPDVYSYIVYLPNECRSLTVSAEPYNAFAREVSVSSGELNEGYNKLVIHCVAENTTSSDYVIIAYVMPEYLGYTPEIINAVKITGNVNISGTMKSGSTLNAVLENSAAEQTYSLSWYRDSELIANGSSYTVGENDKNHTISCIATGNGNYYGSISSIVFRVLENGEVVNADEYITKEGIMQVESIIMLATVAVALFFALGIIVGSKRDKNKS